MRVQLIKYMQAAAVVAFMSCISSMISVGMGYELIAAKLFFASLLILLLSLLMALIEILLSGVSLKMELNRKTARH